jgi:hypothetical protein
VAVRSARLKDTIKIKVKGGGQSLP